MNARCCLIFVVCSDEYDILPVLMSEQNRNPVRLTEHKLGIESWGAELMFRTAAKEFSKWLKTGRKPFNSDNSSRN